MFHSFIHWSHHPQAPYVPSGGTPPEELRKLCMDTVPVVKAAARDHWVALGGGEPGVSGVSLAVRQVEPLWASKGHSYKPKTWWNLGMVDEVLGLPLCHFRFPLRSSEVNHKEFEEDCASLKELWLIDYTRNHWYESCPIFFWQAGRLIDMCIALWMN